MNNKHFSILLGEASLVGCTMVLLSTVVLPLFKKKVPKKKVSVGSH
jgi:cytochrome c biogenesis factor